jgi:hypothetical protein
MRKVFGMAAPLLVLISFALARPAGWIVSDFSTGTEGWEIVGGAVGPTWTSHEGNPPGSISAEGEGLAGWYFHAPAKFYGNRSNFYGRTLRYDVKFGDFDREAKDDVVLRGGGLTLVYDDRTVPLPLWSGRFILLSASAGWEKRVGAMRTEATRAELEKVLKSLTDLEIRGGSANGTSATYLDNVSFDAPMWAVAAGP